VFAFSPPDIGDTLIFNGFNFQPQKISIIQGADSTIMVNTFTNTFTGNFVGDGSGLTNIKLDDNSLQRVNILSSDSSVIVDINTNSFFGNFDGDGRRLNNVRPQEGLNYRFNIIGDDSTIMLDTLNRVMNAETLILNNLLIKNNFLNFSSEDSLNTNNQRIQVVSNSSISEFSMIRNSNTDMSLNPNLIYGRILFERNDINGSVATGVILGLKDSIILAQNPDGNFSNSESFLTYGNNKLGIGLTLPEERLDVNGNAIIRGNGTFIGTVNAASFNGSLVSDDSTTIVDSINGTISVSSFIQFGSLTTLERDALSASNGMVIYNTTDNKFQGYANGIWVNLH
jgi:hypothetical protein